MKLQKTKGLLCLLLALVLALIMSGCGDLSQAMDVAEDVYKAVEAADSIVFDGEAASEGFDQPTEEAQPSDDEPAGGEIDEYGSYTEKDEVALYIFTYGHLPENFITKAEAREKGWEGGSLEPYFPGCCIGGDSFGNREGLLPKKDGRTYTECDIDTLGADSRGAKRIVFSNDGLVYYTDDHYESFTLLYGEE